MENEDLIKQLEVKKVDIIDKAKRDVAQLDATILTLMYLSTSYVPSSIGSDTKTNLSDKYLSFNPKWTIRDKVAFVLKSENKFLHIRQIADILHKLDPKISIDEYTTKLYTPIGQLKKEGKVYKQNIGNSNANTFWGSVNWITGTGEIKSGHEFDENQLRHQRSKSEVEI